MNLAERRPAARATLDEAARAGNASLFGSGVNPGYADQLAAVASGRLPHRSTTSR